MTEELLRGWPLPQPDDGAGKDARGHVLVVGGARDTPGAALLAGLAALRVGAGKLTVATVEATAPDLATAVPEAAVVGLPAAASGSLGHAAAADVAELARNADAMVIGPGLRGADDTSALVARVLATQPVRRVDGARGPLVVLDAMALTCGAVSACSLSGPAVATPNAKEASLLLGRPADEPRDEPAIALAKRLAAVVAVGSVIAAPDGRLWQVDRGGAGLGTSGSGDVLAGAIAGLAARGAAPEQAAVWGVHLHAAAGDRLAARIGPLGFLARELLDELPRLLARLA